MIPNINISPGTIYAIDDVFSDIRIIPIRDLRVGDMTYTGGIVFEIEYLSDGLRVVFWDPINNFFTDQSISFDNQKLCIRKRERH